MRPPGEVRPWGFRAPAPPRSRVRSRSWSSLLRGQSRLQLLHRILRRGRTEERRGVEAVVEVDDRLRHDVVEGEHDGGLLQRGRLRFEQRVVDDTRVTLLVARTLFLVELDVEILHL